MNAMGYQRDPRSRGGLGGESVGDRTRLAHTAAGRRGQLCKMGLHAADGVMGLNSFAVLPKRCRKQRERNDIGHGGVAQSGPVVWRWDRQPPAPWPRPRGRMAVGCAKGAAAHGVAVVFHSVFFHGA